MKANNCEPIEDLSKETKNEITLLLDEIKGKTGANDVRFRIRDWRDKSIVYVPKWILGAELDDSESALAQRFYNNDDEPPIDCFVGLVALKARLEEEKASKNKNEELIKELQKKLVRYKEIEFADCIRIDFSNLSEAENKLFKEFNCPYH